MSNHLKSYSSLAFAQVIVGANIVIAKTLVPHMPVFILLFMRFFIASIILGLLCYLKTESPFRDDEGARLSLKDWIVFFSQALCAGFLFNVFLLSGLHYTDASSAGVISSTTPAMIAVLSYFVIKEKLGTKRIFSIMLAVVGLIVLSLGKAVGETHQMTIFGDLLVFIAVIPESLFTVIAKRFKTNVSPFKLALIVNVFNVILFFPLTLTGIKHVDLSFFQLGYMGLLGLYAMGAALFFIFWYKGLSNLNASVAALFTAIMPISASLLAFLFLNEKITNYDLIGTGLIIISIILGSFNLKKLKFRGFLLND